MNALLHKCLSGKQNNKRSKFNYVNAVVFRQINNFTMPLWATKFAPSFIWKTFNFNAPYTLFNYEQQLNQMNEVDVICLYTQN